MRYISYATGVTAPKAHHPDQGLDTLGSHFRAPKTSISNIPPGTSFCSRPEGIHGYTPGGAFSPPVRVLSTADNNRLCGRGKPVSPLWGRRGLHGFLGRVFALLVPGRPRASPEPKQVDTRLIARPSPSVREPIWSLQWVARRFWSGPLRVRPKFGKNAKRDFALPGPGLPREPPEPEDMGLAPPPSTSV